MKTKSLGKYQIKVYALGYDSTTKIVEAPSLREARKSESEAITEWLAHNDIDSDSRGLAFTQITLVN